MVMASQPPTVTLSAGLEQHYSDCRWTLDWDIAQITTYRMCSTSIQPVFVNMNSCHPKPEIAHFQDLPAASSRLAASAVLHNQWVEIRFCEPADVCFMFSIKAKGDFWIETIPVFNQTFFQYVKAIAVLSLFFSFLWCTTYMQYCNIVCSIYNSFCFHIITQPVSNTNAI